MLMVMMSLPAMLSRQSAFTGAGGTALVGIAPAKTPVLAPVS